MTLLPKMFTTVHKRCWLQQWSLFYWRI